MNLKKIFLVLLISISIESIFAQQDGYWDKDRATTKEINVSARSKIVIKTEDLPTGTTEIVFRITLLDENQQMANSLVSVLKAIPDPTGISQGSAGAVFLASKISGEDKCTYSIFTNEEIASDFQKNAKIEKACYTQKTPISKDAKRLSLDKSPCLTLNTTNLWFGFESKNWLLKQRIVLEVVPWIDIKMSRGWTIPNRKLILNQCKTSNLAKKLTNSDDFCVCILEKIQKKYKHKEFENLLAVEKSKAFKDFGNQCFKETDASTTLTIDLRNQASILIQNNNFAEAITKYSNIINSGQANALDYSGIGYCYICTKQYGKALKFLKEGEKLDDTELLLKINLAHAYLFNDNFKDAKSIHKKYQSQNSTDSLTWSQKVKLDFSNFEKAGLPTTDFDRILKLLED